MGKGPKHNLNRTRNNPIFKVAGVNAKDKKGKAKEVVSKIKKISGKQKVSVDELDERLKSIQHTCVAAGKSISGTHKKTEIIQPAPVKPDAVKDSDMTDLAEMLESKNRA